MSYQGLAFVGSDVLICVVCVCMCVRVCMHVCACVCMRAYVRACVCLYGAIGLPLEEHNYSVVDVKLTPTNTWGGQGLLGMLQPARSSCTYVKKSIFRLYDSK